MSQGIGGLEPAKRALETNTRRVRWSGRLLLAALVLEVFFPMFFAKDADPIEIVIGVACAIAVALGVWGELHFGDKVNDAADELKDEADRQVAGALTKSSEAHERAALAEQRAAEANSIAEGERLKREELEARRADRRLTTEQFNLIVSRLSAFAPVKVGIICSAHGTLEAAHFAGELKDALDQAGWTVAEATRTDLRQERGFWVEKSDDASALEHRAAPELRATLQAVGIVGNRYVARASGGTLVGDVDDASSARVLLHVGEHPRGY